MLFSEAELKKMIKHGLKKITLEEEIKFNILNFIHCIHLNRQDFYKASFDSKLFGNIEMTFKKEANCLIGHCRTIVKKQNRVIDYLFTENGYEHLKEVIKG
ncbi:hypothetical protein LN736_01440 [Clostridium sp. WLY-B-L2]|uniref:Uncharacterized protein n=1 Tax=Clostridium aromativorans TaxID=2836848 RepID=A0ABS8N406_9CLOT|nr:hypothetical protein [Clostridium aromativorans]MCC9293538.1 hypothetical protein [Clostridium aromativorans]